MYRVARFLCTGLAPNGRVGVALCLALILGVTAASGRETNQWQPLYERYDPGLQAKLEAMIAANPAWQRLVRQKRLAIGVVDLNGVPRYARANGNQMMYAASLPKIAILLAAYVAFEDGTLEETEEVHRDLSDMIRTSSNSAATRVIDRLGMERIGEILKDPRFKFYDEDRGGGLWVGKRYAAESRRYPDPLHGISHGATVTQVCRFYYLLTNGRIINTQRSEEILADLANPGLNHKFVGVLRERAPRARLFRKSGTWRNWHSDSVLVRGQGWRNYILVGMVESPRGETVLRELVPEVERILAPRRDASDQPL